MHKRCLRTMFILALAAPAAVICATAALADNPSWAEQQARNAEMQRQALQQQAQQNQQSQQGQFGRVGLYDRWKAEWLQQHPGQPVPSMGVLEHMHSGQIMNATNVGFAKMREERQAELQRQHQMSRNMQEQKLAAQNITWTPQQWQAWEKEYDAQMHQRANEYLEAVRQAGEMEREEQRRKALGF